MVKKTESHSTGLEEDILNEIVTSILISDIESIFKGCKNNVWTNLYGGAVGVAVFLAEIYKVYKNERAKQKVLQIVKRLESYYYNNTKACESLGLSEGVGAAIYGSYKIGSILERPSSFEFAKKIAVQSEQFIYHKNHTLDFLNGLPGYLLVVSHLYSHTASPELLALINNLVKLIENRLTSLKATPGHLMTGLSHGLAGIVLAMSKAYKFSANDAAIEIARSTLKLENKATNDRYPMWPDYRYDPPIVSNSWCHGATGIGLSRIALLQEDPLNEDAYNDMLKALSYTIENPISGIDHVCCGNLGRVELILSASFFLNSDDFLIYSQNLAREICKNARIKGGFTEGKNGYIKSVGLFQGFAGIGLQLLRVLHPKKVNSFLLFD